MSVLEWCRIDQVLLFLTQVRRTEEIFGLLLLLLCSFSVSGERVVSC